MEKKHRRFRFSSVQIMALGFIVIIFLGALILSLPISINNPESFPDGHTPFIDALFTATSATCVTGLVIYDTFSQWSEFGQFVILLLIQIGGLGFITLLSMFTVFSTKKNLSLRERSLLMQTSGNSSLSNTKELIVLILKGTGIIEGIGAILLSIRFIPEFGFWKGIYFGLFHSISAFCNAGFDLMGFKEPNSSLTSYVHDPYVNIVVALLIILGGISFLVWHDFVKHKFHFKKYSLLSKLILITTAFLLIAGWIVFFITEENASMKDMNIWERILASFFQSVTTRTAGFATIDQGTLSSAGTGASIFLMFIGGSSGSTAGGIKTITFAVILLSTLSIARNKTGVHAFKKRIDDQTVKKAFAIVVLYVGAILLSTILVCSFDGVSLTDSLFESVSAMATVGLTTGITSTLSLGSKIVLSILMYTGRIGGFSFALALFESRQPLDLLRPVEKIIVG